jgi:hypothetical protein
MDHRRRVVQIIVLAAVGVACVIGGAYAYQVSITDANQHNNNCPAGALCSIALPNPIPLYIEYLGWVSIVAAGVLGLHLAWLSRGTRVRPA